MYDATAAKPEVGEVEVAESDLLWTSIEWRQAQERSDTMNGTAWLKNRGVPLNANFWSNTWNGW